MSNAVDLANPEIFRNELEPRAAELLDRHLSMVSGKAWSPHEYVPYSDGQDFEKGYEWSPAESPLNQGVRSALYVNLLTEDNLPYYYRIIDVMFGSEGAFGEWNRRWTAEEGRHSIVIRDYVTTARLTDPIELERGRMAQVSKGEVPNPSSPLTGVVYVSLQELATKVAHFKTGDALFNTPGMGRLGRTGREIMRRVAADESLHHFFYRDLGSAALELNPSAFVVATAEVVKGFEMPGTGIPNFDEHKVNISDAGIYGATEFLNHVLKPVIEGSWKIDQLEGLDPQAEKAREAIFRRMRALQKVSSLEGMRREHLTAEMSEGLAAS